MQYRPKAFDLGRLVKGALDHHVGHNHKFNVILPCVLMGIANNLLFFL